MRVINLILAMMIILSLLYIIPLPNTVHAQQLVDNYAISCFQDSGQRHAFKADNGRYYVFIPGLDGGAPSYNLYYWYSDVGNKSSGAWSGQLPLGDKMVQGSCNDFGVTYDSDNECFYAYYRDAANTMGMTCLSITPAGNLTVTNHSAIWADGDVGAVAYMPGSQDIMYLGYTGPATYWSCRDYDAGCAVGPGCNQTINPLYNVVFATSPSLLSLGGDRVLFWGAATGGGNPTYARRYNGVTWDAQATSTRVADNNSRVDACNIYGTNDAWITQQSDTSTCIEVMKYNYTTNTFSDYANVSLALGYAAPPVIQMDKTGNTYVFWTDQQAGADNLYFSWNDGTNWHTGTGGNGTVFYDASIEAIATEFMFCEKILDTPDEAGVYFYAAGNAIYWKKLWADPAVTSLTAIVNDCDDSILRGDITSVGFGSVVERGFHIDYDSNHSTWDMEWSEVGSFSTGIYYTNVATDPETTYYYRAFIEDAAGTIAYGAWTVWDSGSCGGGAGSAYTPPGGVVVDTDAASSVATNSATLNGDIASTGSYPCTVRGFEWGETALFGDTWTESGSFGTGVFNHGITGLIGGTTYYYRAIAYNAAGWSWGITRTFTTDASLPTCQTLLASRISVSGARLNGQLLDDGGPACRGRFQYWETGNTSTMIQTAWVPGFLSGYYHWEDITGLANNTSYTFRVIFNNAIGNCTGGNLTFTTSTAIGYSPTDCLAIPRIDEPVIDLIWVPADGSDYSVIRYREGNVPPANYTQGSLVGITVGTAIAHENLVPGTTYSYSIWGKSGDTYSANCTNCIATCSLTISPGTMPSADTGSWWTTTDYTVLDEMPFFAQINDAADQIQLSRNFFWILISLFIGLVAFMAMLKMSGGNELVAAFAAAAVIFAAVMMRIIVPSMGLPLAFIPIGIVFLRSRLAT